MRGEILTPDICVIGAGAGGLSAAGAAAAYGVSVVLVDQGQLGRRHPRTGLPAAALRAAAARAEMLGRARSFGLALPRPKIDFGEVHDHLQAVIDAVTVNDSAERMAGLGVQVIQGTAAFTGPRTVTVTDGSEISARRFIIATGSSPAIPPITGLEEVTHFTTETIFALRVCPKHLLVIGAGASGLEIAQAFQRLGATVTVFDAAQPLAGREAECAGILLDKLAREGIVIHRGVQVIEAKQARAKIQLTVRGMEGEQKIEGSHLLIATGREPKLAELNLAAAAIIYDRRGIVVDKGLKTSNKKVYAIGAAAAGDRFAEAEEHHAQLVIGNALFRRAVRVDPSAMPRVTLTDPEFAQVGLTEADAAARRMKVTILRWPYLENDRAQAEQETRGHIKVITSKRGKILGAAIVGAGAGDLITGWTLAITHNMNIGAFAGLAVPYLTFADISKRAAMGYFTPHLSGTWIRRMMAAVRLLG
jgi:pyruvate/2-oxoglutarate dehydrogenase complex dihydrolipoamide dehydrogenase (E3) component